VEFVLVIPIFLTLVVSIGEFSFLFTSYLSTSFASRDAVQLAAEMGDTPGSDCVTIERIEQDVSPPANRTLIHSVEIFWSDNHGNPRAGAINVWNRGGTYHCVMPSGREFDIPYTPGAMGYPEADRCNIVSAAGCAPGHTAIDTIGVRISYQYTWLTPFPGLVGIGTAGPMIVSSNMMRLEPVK
jgi:hypothetical protein